MAVALFLHLVFFTHVGGLWRDEVHSVQMASLPSVSTTFESLRHDSFPLLTTLALRGWIHAGLGDDRGLRLFGFIIGVLLLGGLWWTCRLLGCSHPLISLGLVGLNAWVIRTTDSIRPYGLGTALIVATLGCVWKAVETSRGRWFIVAGVLAVLSVQCMYQSAFLLLAICLGGAIVFLRDWRVREAIGVVLVGLAAAVSLVPYLPSIAAAQDWGMLVRSPVSMKRLLDVFFLALASGSVVALWAWFGLAILSGALGVQVVLSHGRRVAGARSHLVIYCWTVLLAGTVVYLAAMKGSQLLTQPWYYVPLASLVAPTLDATVRLAATTNWRRLARAAAALAIACSTVIPGWRQLQERWTNIDVVAARLGAGVAAEDLIVLNPFWIGITFERYYKGPARWVTVPPLEDIRITRFDLIKSAMARPNPLAPVLEMMTKTLQSGHRVWWVQGLPGSDSGPPHVLPPAPLPRSGWYFGPYLLSWARQTFDLLRTHGLRSEVLDARTGGPVLPYENVAVTMVSGWH